MSKRPERCPPTPVALGWQLTEAWAFVGLDCAAVKVCWSTRLLTEWALGLDTTA